MRKLEENLQNLEAKAKGKEQLCKNLQEKVHTWLGKNSSFVSWLLSFTCTWQPLKYILGKRAWRAVRFHSTFSNYIGETAAPAFWKTKGERRNVYCPSAKGTSDSSNCCLHTRSMDSHCCCSFIIRKLEIYVYPSYPFSDCGVGVQT